MHAPHFPHDTGFFRNRRTRWGGEPAIACCGLGTLRRVRHYRILAITLSFVSFSTQAWSATWKTFDLAWSGESEGNSARATGQITLDTSLFANPGSTSSGTNWLGDFSITVTGAGTGNGTWDRASFSAISFSTGPNTLDFSGELVGQGTWGSTTIAGPADFYLSGTEQAPHSTDYFTLTTRGGSGYPMVLTSFKPVPLETSNVLKLTQHFRGPGTGVNERVYALGEDGEGRLVVGGYFRTAEGTPASGIARFHPDSSRDPTFHPGTGIQGGVYGYITDLLVLDDDSIIAVGDFTSYNGTPRGNIVKISPTGAIDGSFAAGLGASGPIRAIKRTSTGQFLIGGEFSDYDGVPRSRLAMLNPDGTLDPSFDTDIGFPGSDDYVDELELLSEDRFLVAGQFHSYRFHSTENIARIEANGQVDPGFVLLHFDSYYFEALKVLDDGKILVGGTGYGAQLYRLNSTGSVDNTFHPLNLSQGGVYGIQSLSGGRLLITGSLFPEHPNIIVLDEAGNLDDESLDTGITPNWWVGPTLISSDGGIYIGGAFSNIGEAGYGRLAKLDTEVSEAYFESQTGTIIEGLQAECRIKVAVNVSTPVELSLWLESDDPATLSEIYVDSTAVIYPGQTSTPIYVYVSAYDNSQVDGPRSFRLRMSSPSPQVFIRDNETMTFTLNDDELPQSVFLEKSVEVLQEGEGGFQLKLKRFLNDTGEVSVRVRTNDGTALAGRDYAPMDREVVFPDGIFEQTVTLHSASVSPDPNPLRTFTVELYNPAAGTVIGTHATCTVTVNDRDDPGSTTLIYSVPDQANLVRFLDIARDSDGVVYALAQYKYDSGGLFSGHLLKFSNGGAGEYLAHLPPGSSYLNDLEISPDGMIYAAGTGFVYRYHPSGQRDTTWTNPFSGSSNAFRVLALPDGKVLIAGSFYGGGIRRILARFNASGGLDPGFDIGGFAPAAEAILHDIGIDPEGKVLISGVFASIQGASRTNVARLNPNGTIDLTFNATTAITSQGLTNYVRRIEIAPAGDIYLGGNTYLIRVRPDGTLDSGFTRIKAEPFALQPDGKIACVDPDLDVANRYHSTGLPDTDFQCYGRARDVYKILVAPEGQLIFCGGFTGFFGGHKMLDGFDVPGIASLKGGEGAAPGSVSWDMASTAIGEGIGSPSFRILRHGSLSGTVGIHYTLVPETAEIDTDVAAHTGYHLFSPGETDFSPAIHVVDDGNTESPETFRMVLHNPFGGVGLSTDARLACQIVDDDGPNLGDWLALHFPESPLDPSFLQNDEDADGAKTVVEWMTDSDPRAPGDAKHPRAMLASTGAAAVANMHLGISFYHDVSRTECRTVVERSLSLGEGSWSPIWDSSLDPLLESPLITSPPESGKGWMSIRSPEQDTDEDFLRIRYFY